MDEDLDVCEVCNQINNWNLKCYCKTCGKNDETCSQCNTCSLYCMSKNEIFRQKSML